ncbi:MAG: HAMP domain-containing histidine kinase [Roseivirga sp.]|nr:HAMP domain-containing histidine kinase [Roseivirga sp.]
MRVILVRRLVLLCLLSYTPHIGVRESHDVPGSVFLWEVLNSPSLHAVFLTPDVIYYSIIVLVFGAMLWSYCCYRKKQRLVQDLIEKNNFLILRKNKAEEQIGTLEEKYEAALKLDKFKENSIQMVVHDIRNSLNAIMGLSQEEPSPGKMEIINRSGECVLNLVTNMLDIQRLKEAKIALDKQHCFVADLLTESITPLKYLLESKHIRVITSVPETLLLYADLVLLKRILGNLLFNAAKFSHYDSRIDVCVTKNEEDGRIGFSITDYGEGIKENELPYVFEKYWSTGNTKISQASSIGLGLTFCKLAIEAHGGTIQVTSAPQKFTTVKFSIPVANIDRPHSQPERPFQDKSDSMILAKDLPLIAMYAEKLSRIEVHEYSQVSRIVKELEQAGVTSIWKDKLMSSVYEADPDKFRDLVAMLK